MYVPTNRLRTMLISESHDTQWAGHPSRDKMLALMTRTCYWPRMEVDVEAYVRSCLMYH